MGAIKKGILLFLGVEADDTAQRCERLVERVLNYRIFSDTEGRMNLNVKEVRGQLLVVSQFTLVANTNKGNRASFSSSASPDKAYEFYEQFLENMRASTLYVQSGRFGADMQVSLVNDGPVTFLLEA